MEEASRETQKEFSMSWLRQLFAPGARFASLFGVMYLIVQLYGGNGQVDKQFLAQQLQTNPHAQRVFETLTEEEKNEVILLLSQYKDFETVFENDQIKELFIQFITNPQEHTPQEVVEIFSKVLDMPGNAQLFITHDSNNVDKFFKILGIDAPDEEIIYSVRSNPDSTVTFRNTEFPSKPELSTTVDTNTAIQALKVWSQAEGSSFHEFIYNQGNTHFNPDTGIVTVSMLELTDIKDESELWNESTASVNTYFFKQVTPGSTQVNFIDGSTLWHGDNEYSGRGDSIYPNEPYDARSNFQTGTISDFVFNSKPEDPSHPHNQATRLAEIAIAQHYYDEAYAAVCEEADKRMILPGKIYYDPENGLHCVGNPNEEH